MSPAYDWTTEVEKDSEFVVFPDKTRAAFRVTKFEKGFSQKRSCPMAILTLEVTANGTTKELTDRIVLHSDLEWKICQFFTSIGQRQSGQRIRPDWTRVEGARGEVEVKLVKWTGDDGQVRDGNEIGRYFPQADNRPTETAPVLPTDPNLDGEFEDVGTELPF